MATASPEVTEQEQAADPVPKKQTLHSMVLEALASNKASKGSSLRKIKAYIIKEYPETQENFSNKRLQTAIKKGLDSSEIIRPKGSEETTGFVGNFLLNRALIAQKAKEKKKKATKAPKAEGTTEKPKKSKPKATDPKAKLVKATKPKETTEKGKKTATKKKPLAAAKVPNAKPKANRSLSKKTPTRRESFSGTPKISKADRTKAGRVNQRRRDS